MPGCSSRRRSTWIMAALLGLLAWAAPATAKTSRTIRHPYEGVWPAAVRFLRVDQGYTIVDKDSEAGYVVFELEDDAKVYRGALEVIRRKDDAGRATVELSLDIEDRPTFMEHGILDRMMKKLRKELGPEPEVEAPAEPAPPPDEGQGDKPSPKS